VLAHIAKLKCEIMINMTDKCIYRYVNLLLTDGTASYMLQPPIVAIFREVFFEGYTT
jgi:hypothetical protein